MHYVAPRSLLVFDHVSRGISLLHAGSDAERASLRREVITALRGPMPPLAVAGSFSAPSASLGREAYMAGVRRVQEYIAAGDVYQLVLASRFQGSIGLIPFQVYRALRLINPSPYMYYCRAGRYHGRGFLTRGAGEAQRRTGRAAAHRRHPAARHRCG